MLPRESQTTHLILLFFIGACSSSSSPTAGPDSGTLSPTLDGGEASQVSRLVRATCRGDIDCQRIPSDDTARADCEESLSNLLCSAQERMLSIPDTELAACIQAIGKSCSGLSAPGCAPLRMALLSGTPLLGLGDRCFPGAGECLAGARCAQEEGSECGVCTLLAAEGAPCDDGDCQPHLQCASGICSQKPGLTEACTGQCDRGLCHQGTCVAVEEIIDSACSDEAPCGYGACADGKCVAPGREGDSCVTSKNCASSFACNGGQCAQIARCGKGRQGSPCLTSKQCSKDLVCNGEPNMRQCTAPLADGMACFTSTVCGPNSSCATESSDRVCSPLKQDGSECRNFLECTSRSCNSDGLCGPERTCI